MLGTLTWSAFIHPGAVETSASLAVVGGIIAALLLITVMGRWKWLWSEWLTSLSHRRIGVMYLVLSFIMLGRGFVDAAMIRSQQAISAAGSVDFLAPDHFAQIFTAHGTIMIFFGAMTFMFGLINLVLPLQLEAKDMAFPFLNSMSLWLTAAAAMLINCSLVIGQFAATGWLAYPPLSELAYSPGPGVDYWIWALELGGVGALLGAINFITTILTMRKEPLMKMPMFSWTTLGSMMLVLFAFPILTVTLALLSLDRIIGAHFFTPELGGNAMLYVNLIWAWGHPEVYILILPAFGIFSEVVSTFSHKRLFGYTSMVVATMTIVALSFMVWVHHFFTMGAGADVNAFFGIMTAAIAVPTGVKIFNWLFTMFRGRIEFKTPMLWFMGFVVTFTVGGMTGVLLSIPGVDFQLHNSLFLIAHFHNMIIGGVLFGFFAGFTYWFPRFAGFTLDERLGRWAFWSWLWGFLLAFMPLYALGLMGMTRRLVDVPALPGASVLLWIAAMGVALIALGAFFQVLQVVVSVMTRERRRVGDNPWDSRGPEWGPLPHVEDEHAAGGVLIGILGFALCFGMVWHMWWLSALCLILAIASLMVRGQKHV